MQCIIRKIENGYIVTLIQENTNLPQRELYFEKMDDVLTNVNLYYQLRL